ncbi:MAG: hypothetical protein ABSF83_03485 [Nitrososphaerales archaeon]|jgi:hypothetical protein
MTTQPPAALRARVERLLIRVLVVYTAVAFPFVVVVNVFGGDARARAIILMAAGLVLLWVVLGGCLTLRYRDRVREAVLRVGVRWEWRFLLMATGMALLEEAITTTMTNLAPELGSQIGVAYITASTNYLIVISFSSVVVFVPEFVGWVFLLRRYDFSPNEVFLLYGLLGATMESALSPYAVLGSFWFFVYGLMVYLPAYALPRDRPARTPRLRHYVLAYFVPLAFAVPVALLDLWVAHSLGIHLWPR